MSQIHPPPQFPAPILKQLHMCCPDSKNEVLHKQTEKIYCEERFLCCSDDPKKFNSNVHNFCIQH